ncbi:MAG: MMPL family transporter [Galactobacter sp.]|mgnify:CR=1 FL=1|uniref:MMPL family transporter n=1 Tax=Galactobacter sp. TaxID=2676125 RepID=UPI0025C1BD7F|nr:MMPL family transporter [Galactobacter sp.]
MAELLYKIGKWCARHGWAVVCSWLAALIILGGAVGLSGVKMTEAMDVGDTPTTKVASQVEKLMKESDDSGSGTDSAQMVVSTDNDKKFTSQQKQDIADLIEGVNDGDVATATDPFATDADLAKQKQKLKDGQKELDNGKTKLEDGQKQLDAAQKKLDAAKKQLSEQQQQLDQAKEAAKAQGATDAIIEQQFGAAQAKLDAGSKELESNQKKLDQNQTKLTKNSKKLEDSQTELTNGSKLMKLAADVNMVSDDGTTAVINFTFNTSTGVVEASDQEDVKSAFMDKDADGAYSLDAKSKVAGVTFNFSGSPEVGSIIGVGEIVGVVVAAVVLFIMLGTLIGAGLPLISAIIGVGIGACIAMLIGHITDIASVTPVLGIMLGLAVGIDYSLFIVNRHRTQLKQGHDVVHSAALANGTSGNAVVFAGATVVIALLALNFSGLPFLGLMGTVGAISVVVAVLIAITLTPALLGLLKFKLLKRKERRQAEAADPVESLKESTNNVKAFPRWGAAVATVAGIAVLGTLALPALDMRTNLPDNGSAGHDTSEYVAYHKISDKFGEGQNAQMIILADLPDGLSDNEAQEAQIEIGQELKDTKSVSAVVPAVVSKDNSQALFQLIPESGPTASSTESLVHTLRDDWPLADEYKIGVAGSAAANIDMSEKIVDSLPLYLVIVVGLSLLILIMVFRSLLVPLIATLGFVLSYLAALGSVVAVYQWGWLADFFGVETPGPILSFLPTILVGILFGLAMDYMFFLGSGMREAYAHGMEARKAVVRGVRAGRSVVIAAAIIMISVFGGFIFSEMTMIKPIGFALAFGVLLDAFVVRLVLIPSVMTLLGKSAWWLPKWLDRLIPNVDIEGEKLTQHHTHSREELAASGSASSPSA